VAGLCKGIGAALVLVGLGFAAICLRQMAGDDEYRKAALVAARNPGNVLYEAEFKGAQVRRAFQVVGASGGTLLALNGATLIGLGVIAGRVKR
jgi:hypothetical protein